LDQELLTKAMPAPTPTIGGKALLKDRFQKSMQSANHGAGNCLATAVNSKFESTTKAPYIL